MFVTCIAIQSGVGGGGVDTVFDYAILERPLVPYVVGGHVVPVLKLRDHEICTWGMVLPRS